ncbi:MAG TPA: cyclopropane-fatty-acyl-phospholipid synthase family protein [Caulobacteraceae bacterium]|nr:cyclopropane-fatty-acyl-phospholipid synthase family protein [Caulobacteraceae bacterium]
MSDIAHSAGVSDHRGPIWRLPEIRRAPHAFRTVARLAAQNWRFGALTFVLPSGREITIGGREPGPHARLIVHDFRFVRRVLTAGDIGFAEGFIAKEWDTPDLAKLLRAFTLNLDKLTRLLSGNPLVIAANAVGHFFHRNTRRGSRRNIHAHYDLGNRFYASWLDPSMTYSSARFSDAGADLHTAQHEKYASLARAMDLQAGHSVLEIGCGWGGFAEFAAKDVGAKVTAITISREQFDYTRERMARAGLSDRVDVQLIDYRDVTGAFDRIASIEMFEAVGERYWPTYFETVRERLKPGGRAGLQIITIRDDLFADYRRRADFIQKYIFPGGMLPSEERLAQVVESAKLGWQRVERFGQDYARTLHLWADRFMEKWGQIHPLGFDERFRRLWLFYLGYCEAGFATGRTDVIQLSLNRA